MAGIRTAVGRSTVLLFAAAFAGWFVVYFAIAPPFGGVDVFIFKDAGANLATGHGFRAIPAPFFDGEGVPKLFASYTPLYPLLYGLWGLAFGIGPYTNAFFDLCIAASAAILTLLLVLPHAASPRERLAISVAVALTLPAGTVFLSTDRPEILAYAVSAALLIAWSRFSGFRYEAVAIASAAIVFLIHPFAGLLLLLILSSLTLLDPPNGRGRTTLGLRLRTILTGWTLFAAVIAAVGAIFVLLDVEALQRFSRHAVGGESGAGVMRQVHSIAGLLPFYIANWKHAFFSSGLASLTMSGSLLAGAAICLPFAALLIARAADRPETVQRTLFAGLLLGLYLLPLLAFPRQNNYFAYVRSMIPLLIIVSSTEAAAFLRSRHVPALLLVVGCVFCAPSLAVDLITRGENLNSYRLAARQAAALPGSVHGDAITAISPVLYHLIKPAQQRLVSLDYVSAGNAARVATLIVGRAGQPADARIAPVKDDLRSIGWNSLPGGGDPMLVRVFGRRVMRSQWGWTFDLYQRSPPLTPDAPNVSGSSQLGLTLHDLHRVARRPPSNPVRTCQAMRPRRADGGGRSTGC